MVKRKTTRTAPKTQAAALRRAASDLSKATTQIRRAAKMKR